MPRRSSTPDPQSDPDPSAEDDDTHVRGGYLFTAEPDAPPMVLAEPVEGRSAAISVSAAADAFQSAGSSGAAARQLRPGAHYLLGDPGRHVFEVVQAEVADPMPAPGSPAAVRRAQFGTVRVPHPAGTPVTAIRVEYVDDWDRWNPSQPRGRRAEREQES